jgi:hypothetical protein
MLYRVVMSWLRKSWRKIAKGKPKDNFWKFSSKEGILIYKM